MLVAQKTEAKIKDLLKAEHNIKEFNEEQEQVAKDILVSVMKNESLCNWESTAGSYIKDPDVKSSLSRLVDEICLEQKVDGYMGAILFNSKME